LLCDLPGTGFIEIGNHQMRPLARKEKCHFAPDTARTANN
jgi:hypothetical protein